MKVFIIHEYEHNGCYWSIGNSAFDYRLTINKAFSSRQEAHKYLKTNGVKYEDSRWTRKTTYNTYLYKVQQVTVN